MWILTLLPVQLLDFLDKRYMQMSMLIVVMAIVLEQRLLLVTRMMEHC